jgi:pimeloyl-ACP methyl ester carboxylesterase
MATEASRGQYVEVDGARIYYEEQGSGEPLLLLHGGLMSSAAWGELIPLLATRFRIITPDSRGHGRSTNSTGRLSYGQLADDMVGLIAALGLRRPAVGGWSDGGQVALEIGVRYPHAARALVICGALFDFGEEYQGAMRQTFGMDATGAVEPAGIEAALGESTPWFRSMFAGDDDAWRAFLRQSVTMWLDYPGLTEAELRGVTAPALVVIGDRDDLVPIETATAMYRMLPRGELAVFPNTTHFLPRTHAAWFAATVREFLDRHMAS